MLHANGFSSAALVADAVVWMKSIEGHVVPESLARVSMMSLLATPLTFATDGIVVARP